MNKIQRIGLLTSGGDAPGMNAAIRAVVLTAHHYCIEVIGFYHGYNGLINQEYMPLDLASINGIIHRGGTILKSGRCKAFLDNDGLHQAANTLIKVKIDALIVIGGDGSFKGLIALSNFWNGQIIGIPGTIDNDIDGSDFTIGFASAVNTALEATDKIRDTADAFERVFIVELMGRHSGHITFNVGIASAAEQVISFENFNPQDRVQKLQALAADISQAKKLRHSSYLIVIAENLWPGGATQFAKELTGVTKIDCTACIFGHIQRGGSPVAKDRIMATKMGVAAVQELLKGTSNVMIGEVNSAIATIALPEAIKHQKTVSDTLVNAQRDFLAMSAQTIC